MQFKHTPVFLEQAIEYLNVHQGQKYVDCTFGGGGYSKLISAKGGKVLALDIDQDAIKSFNHESDSKIQIIHANFENVEDVARNNQFVPVSGVVFDLGVSSFQLDNPEKGFSFMRKGPLDMRMDKNTGISAGKLLDLMDEKSLVDLFYKFSDEIHSGKIAKLIVAARKTKPYWELKCTTDLADLIKNAVISKDSKHPATKVFQALRMAVNDEVGALHRGLIGALNILDKGGRIVVVSFHSVEDRIVKNHFKEWENGGEGKIFGDVMKPDKAEVEKNIRSRSAKMRVFEKAL